MSWWVGGNGYLVLCKMWLKWKGEAKQVIGKKSRKKTEIGLTGFERMDTMQG